MGRELTELVIILLSLLVVVLVILGIRAYYKRMLRLYRPKYPRNYICIDGHSVRSISESLIDNWLHFHNICHQYEDYIEKNLGKWKYDWFLPDYDLYLEFFGYAGKKYYTTRKQKEKLYQHLAKKLVAIEPQDLADINGNLARKIGLNLRGKSFMPQTLEFCPNCGENLLHRYNINH